MQIRTFPNLTVIRKTKGKLPRLPFSKLKNAVLGKSYELSIVFASPAETRRLNRAYRNKDKAANILSFPLSKKSGELYLCEREIRKSEKEFGLAGTKLLVYFIIHGMLHLEGASHGSKMRKSEARLHRRFGL
ncbi:MAG: rRNA maturation RNase YbeY [bacterium]|nr:rRNA maturation RNase YbeY [bacterium]